MRAERRGVRWPWGRRSVGRRAGVDDLVAMPDGGHTVRGAPYLVGNLIVEAGTGRPLVRVSGVGGGVWEDITENDPEYARWKFTVGDGK